MEEGLIVSEKNMEYKSIIEFLAIVVFYQNKNLKIYKVNSYENES